MYMSVYLLLLASSCLLCKPRYVVNDGGKVGGSPQLDRLEGSVVGLDHSGYTSTVGVLGVPVQSKLVGHLRRTEIHNHACRYSGVMPYLASNLGSKSESWKQLVTE